ncbi:regulator of (H+)-ATPase in vacuolar membrane [Oleoguttula sp. CCFEE 5521]
MPSLSPGHGAHTAPLPFTHIAAGSPASSLQALTTLTYRWKRYILYISGRQLNILRSSTNLVQALNFDDELVAVEADKSSDGLGNGSGRIAVAGGRDVWILEPVTGQENRVSWRKGLILKRQDDEDEARTLSWGNEGEVLVGGSKRLSLFSTVEGSRESSPIRSTATLKELDERTPLWTKDLASPVAYAAFSPSASLIATTSVRDRLVKIWRRLSFEDALFDYAYLPHPGMVMHLEWRRPDPLHLEMDDLGERRGSVYSVRHEDELEVLHTFCTDGVMRVWKTGSHQDLDILTLHTSIDLVGAIPQSPTLSYAANDSSTRPSRYAFTLTSGSLSGAITAALSKTALSKPTHAQEHLKELRAKHPDIIVTLDGRGRMSAWGFSSPGTRHRRPSTPSKVANGGEVFHVAHAEDLGIRLENGENARFESWVDGDEVNVLVHRFTASVQWWKGGVERLLSPGAVEGERLGRLADWGGAANGISGLVKTIDGGEVVAWTGRGSWQEVASRLTRQSIMQLNDRVLNAQQSGPDPWLSVAATGQKGLAVIAFTTGDVECFDTDGKLVGARTRHSLDAPSVWVLRLPQTEDGPAKRSVYLCYDRYGAWLTVHAHLDANDQTNFRITEGDNDGIPFVDAKDSALQPWSHTRVVAHPRKPRWVRAVSAEGNGVIYRRDMPAMHFLDQSEGSKEPALVFSTGVKSTTAFDATASHAALVAETTNELLIVDLKDGYVEHRQKLQRNVRQAQFSASSSGTGRPRSLLAISYDESVDVMAEGHYEPHSGHSTWQHIRSISITGIGLAISSIAWAPEGQLAIAAGNSVFVASRVTIGEQLGEELRDRLDVSVATSAETASLAQLLKQPLAIWHPHSLLQISLRGHLHAAMEVLRKLEHRLRFFGEGDVLHPTFEQEPGRLTSMSLGASTGGLDMTTVNVLRAALTNIDLPRTSLAEQGELKHVFETVAYVQEHVNGLDANALRYLFIWKFRILQASSVQTLSEAKITNGDHTSAPSAPTMTYREILFATHSTTQQPLLELLVAHHTPLTPITARALGLSLWLRELHAPASEGSALASLDQLFESLAQTAYRSVYPPDPAKAALYFLALRKKGTLLALWRVAVGNKEQRATINFLKRDFGLEENRTAAKKNAYALMGKRRFEYAAAFFLLAGDCQSAVRLLAGQCEDLGLAVGVARCFAGDGSEVLRELVEGSMLSKARDEGDRWCMAWCYTVLRRPKEMAKALIAPMRVLREGQKPRARYWQQDDPLTLTMYEDLRAKATKSGKKSEKLGTEQWEYEAVLRSARILRRQGLLLQALELVKTWEFVPAERHSPEDVDDDEKHVNGVAERNESTAGLPGKRGGQTDPLVATADRVAPPARSLLDEFDVADPPPTVPKSQDTAKSAREAKAAELLAKMKAKKTAAVTDGQAAVKEKPTQFDEPAASSILDSFGF